MALQLPPIAALPARPDEEVARALDLLFEPSPALHALALPVVRAAAPPLASYDALVDAVRGALRSLQREAHAADAADAADAAAAQQARTTLLAVLGAHPRLGARKVESAQSAAEQAQLQASAGSGEAARLAALNAEYEAAFPGLIYVVFVNGRARDVVMANMRARIDRGDVAQEEIEAIEAMADIAKDRARKLQAET